MAPRELALEEKPTWYSLDGLAARARVSSYPGALYQRLTMPDPDGPQAPPDFDPLSPESIAGFEDFADAFVTADSPAEVAGIKARIEAKNRDRELLTRAGVGGMVAEIGFGLFDPTFLASLAVPELVLGRMVQFSRAVTAAARGAAGASAYELAMHSVDETRTSTESGINISAGVLLSGVLGTLGRAVPRMEMNKVRAGVTEAIRSEAGAAAVARPTTLEAESIARGGKAFSKLAGLVPWFRTDAQRILHSESIAARTTLQELADVAPLLEKNADGIATPTSVESMVARHEGRVADFVEKLRTLYIQHRKDPKPMLVGTAALSREEFYRAVAGAARRGDRDVFPHVAEAARFLREHVFDPLKVASQRLGLLPNDADVVGAESYFRRMYDREAIRAFRPEWDETLTRHFMRKGQDVAEARATASDITRRILGADVGQANFNIRTNVPNAGPLHERVLDVPDEMIEKFLVSDPVKVADAYVRELAPQIEVTKRFGDKDMKDALDKVRQEFDVRRERIRIEQGAGAAKALAKLTDEESEVVDALIRVRDRIYGRAGRLTADASAGERIAVNVARGWLNFVAAGKLGTTALVSAPLDTARVVAQYGFLPSITALTKLIASPAFRELRTAEARRLGAAVEVTLARRVHLASEGAVTEGWTQALANGVYKYSGLNHWTDFSRTLSATLLETRILQTAADVAGGKSIDKFARTRLASLGLDETALRKIHAEVEKHGGAVGTTRVSGSGNWDDYALAARYDAAILKESRQVIIQPGAANRTWWQDTHVGRILAQLKGFSIASPLKLGITPFQLVGQRQYLAAARFAGMMMVGGYLAHALRNTAAGVEVQTDPMAAAAEAFSESGLGGVLPDMLSPVARRFGVLGESSRYADRNVMSAFGGPAFGTLGDAYDFSMNRTANGMSANDLQLLRRLLPFQNLWYLRRGINAIQGEVAEASGMTGADARSFGERFNGTRPLLDATARGGTGTGHVAQ